MADAVKARTCQVKAFGIDWRYRFVFVFFCEGVIFYVPQSDWENYALSWVPDKKLRIPWLLVKNESWTRATRGVVLQLLSTSITTTGNQLKPILGTRAAKIIIQELKFLPSPGSTPLMIISKSGPDLAVKPSNL